jgi:hypothetical protein
MSMGKKPIGSAGIAGALGLVALRVGQPSDAVALQAAVQA